MASDPDQVGVASGERRPRARPEKDVVFLNSGKQRAYSVAKQKSVKALLKAELPQSCFRRCALPLGFCNDVIRKELKEFLPWRGGAMSNEKAPDPSTLR